MKYTKSLGWFFAVGLACDGIAHAQIVGPYGTSPTTFEVDANGLLSDTGTFGTGTLSLSGAGTRMIWYPGKGAFRAGTVSGTYWDDANIGSYSAAFGWNTTASGIYSFASGVAANASGPSSIAMGLFAVASGEGATALGFDSSATGDYATTLDYNTTASGHSAIAMGFQTTASGDYSTSMGVASQATVYGSTAIGWHTTASGYYSSSIGLYTTAAAFDEFVIGRYNVGAIGAWGDTSWNATDPLFEVGNGTDATHLADAFIIYKNGNAILQGALQVAPAGDIPMFTGY